MAKQEEEVAIKIEVDESGAISGIKNTSKSMDDLAASTKKLEEERKKLDLTTKTGRENAAKLTAEIEKNNAIVKKATTQTGAWNDSFKTLAPGISGTVTTIIDMTKAAWAFVATPLGAALAAIAVILSPLISFFRNTGDGMDMVGAQSARLSGALGVLTEKFNNLGRQMADAFDKDKPSSGGAKFLRTLIETNPLVVAVRVNLALLGKIFSDTSAEMQAAAAAAEEYYNILDDIDDAQLNFSITSKEMLQEAKLLDIQAKNSTLTERQRIELLEQSEEIRKKVLETEKDLSLRRLDAIAGSTALNKLQKEQNEDTLEFAKRVIANTELTDEQRKTVADAYTDYLSSIDKAQEALEKNAVKQQKLVEDELANIEKLKLARAKAAKEKEEQDEKDRIAADALEVEASDRFARIAEAEFTTDLNSNEMRAKLKEEQLANLTKQEEARMKKLKDNAKKEEEIERFKTNALLAMTNMLFKERSVARLALNAILKQDALKEIAIHTKTGAIAAYKALAGIPIVGPLLGGLAAAAVVAYGLMSAAGVAGIQFAQGGKVSSKRGTFRGRAHSQGGEDYVNTRTGHRINVEGDENFYVLKKSASHEINRLSSLNVKHGGRAFNETPRWFNEQGGQIDTRQSSVSQSLSVQDIQSIVYSTMSGIKIYTDVKDVIRETDNLVSVEDTARVLS